MQAVIRHSEEQFVLGCFYLLLGVVKCHDFTKKLTVSGAFPSGQHSWNCICNSMCHWKLKNFSPVHTSTWKESKNSFSFLFNLHFQAIVGIHGSEKLCWTSYHWAPSAEISTVGFRFDMRNPLPNCAYHELQEPTQPLLKGQIIPAGTLSRWSDLRLQQLGSGNVTEAWRIMKTWK